MVPGDFLLSKYCCQFIEVKPIPISMAGHSTVFTVSRRLNVSHGLTDTSDKNCPCEHEFLLVVHKHAFTLFVVMKGGGW